MLLNHFCLIALVVGVTSCKDSGGEEELNEVSDEREEQNFSIPNEDLDGVKLEVILGNKKNCK